MKTLPQTLLRYADKNMRTIAQRTKGIERRTTAANSLASRVSHSQKDSGR